MQIHMQKKQIYGFLLLALSLSIFGCSNASDTSDKSTSEVSATAETKVEVHTIDAETAKSMMTEDALILDVRSESEYSEGHIENATLLPVEAILEGKVDALTDLNQTILVYCRSGNRSAKAAKALVELGYTNVYDFGGINTWPYDIVK